MKKTPQDLGREYERSLSKRLGLKQNKGSGSLWYKKGDLNSPGLMVEVKHTSNESFSLKDSLFNKVSKEANLYQTPMMVVKTEGREYMVLDGSWLEDIIAFIEEKMK